MSAFEFQLYDAEQRKLPYQSRNGEIRVGDILSAQQVSSAQFVLIGISENVGPQANLGRAGSENAFSAFAKVFFNTQAYNSESIQKLAFLGQIKQVKQPLDRPEACALVETLDQFLFELLNTYLKPGQIPVLIGGGHNNALPLMRWAAQHNPLSVVNIDAHADLRPTEKRHSGNSFSFALQENLLSAYGVFGLHEAFNNAHIRSRLAEANIAHRFFEDYLQGPFELHDDVLGFLEQQKNPVGIEIDMDAIAMMPSSAMSPSGWSLDQVRSLLLKLGKHRVQIAYLNLTEAAPLDERDDLIVGKALSYLVRDFCLSYKK